LNISFIDFGNNSTLDFQQTFIKDNIDLFLL